ncbi:DUF927 domain-containing protein [Pseudoruegeria sp. HB172150]|uniref:DUF927 domain-containing protein n=1 Tax=Pseudoruegeria sp. HB172150 TaxID=2721164 RepID=UPI001553A484|nr:DUF927 domain-containing protein [Pseudoruegeria sp. HB172150]
MSSSKKIAEMVEEATAEAKAKSKRRTKHGRFKVEYGQVWRELEDESSSKRWVAFVSEVNILARTRNADGEDHGRLLEVIDCDGRSHVWAMPAALLASSGEAIFAELLRLGMEPVPTVGRKWRQWVIEYILTAEPLERVRCVSSIGWHDRSFVLPDETLSAESNPERVILQSTDRLDHSLNTAGTLEEWREQVSSKAAGNSRLVLAVSAGFAAPLLNLTADEGGGFHFRGGSSSGKSTTLTVAGSVWGGGGARGYVQSWRTTDNALEALCATHDDALLCLDEISQIESKSAGAAAYMLANGVGKARAGREGQARKSHEWRLLFLSSGEMGLSDKISESGARIAAGMEVRVIDLRADAGAGLGLFEQLHGASDPGAFAQELKAASTRCYGTAARALIASVVSDLPKAREELAKMRHEYKRSILPADAAGQVSRVADRFALVAAAGELATGLGITGWEEGEALSAVHRCFNDWIAERGGLGSSEVSDARLRIRRAIEVDGHSRFLPWQRDPRTVLRMNTLGYVRREDDDQPDRPPVYYLHASGISELLNGLDRRSVLEGLAEIGVIVRQDVEEKGETKSALNKGFKVPSEKTTKRLYELNFTAVMADGDGDA